MRRGWLSVFSTLAIGFVCLAPPLRAQFVYVANDFPIGTVSAYSIGANGALTPVPGSPFAAGDDPTSVAVDPTGKFAYVANETNPNVSAYSIGANGALTPVPGSPFGFGGFGTCPITVKSLVAPAVAVDPTGKFAYVTGGVVIDCKGVKSFGPVFTFSIGSNGALTGSSFVLTGDTPLAVAVDPTGKFAYVANKGGNVSAYTIDPSTGALTAIAGSPFAAGSGPISVAVDPTGKFAYVANTGGNVSAYTIDPSTGALKAITGSPFAAGLVPLSVAVDPTGKFAYVANEGGNNVSAYTIDPSTGALKAITGSPFAAELRPFSVAVDPAGKFAYVANEGDNTVSAYTIDPSTGALKAVTGSPFLAGTSPLSVAITPLVPFASSFAKLQIAKKGFDLNESFTLGANSNGINPVTENVTLQIGTFSVTIPGGSFKLNSNGRFAFQGVINGVSMQVQIIPLGNNIFTFNAQGAGVDLTGLTNPVTVVLTIGDDTGSTAVTAQFQ